MSWPHIRVAFLPACIALTISCSTARPPDQHLTAADEASIRSLDSTFVQAWLRDDTTAVLSVFSPDALLMPPNAQPVSGLSSIRAFWWPTDGSHTVITAFDRRIEEIGGTRELAYLRGSSALGWVYEKGGKRQVHSSRSNDIFLLAPDSAGKWRITRQIWNQLP